ncbi:MAG: tRNA guanosine(34) transglycosylase Tgt [Candidatus Riflebacteria bacterium]|nr:tRNA guanosine(34) transglycosylase Tgt [Candidatus Riflebacteria bacterium]
MSRLNFKIERENEFSKARAAKFQTLHGEIKTPIFMPVGTRATVKGLTVGSLKEAGTRMLLANTYHLLLRPGPEVFKKSGGIHRFMNWDGPVLTDSGGFQIFSLPHSRELNEVGARFQSYVDKSFCLLSPESSIEMQKAIGSDIMMALDQCIPSTAPFEQAKAAMELTHRWADRSLRARGDSPQAIFGIVQGACHPDLRKQSAEFLKTLPFDGMAIGGLAVGETPNERYQFTELVTEHLPKNLPRYLMGVGTPIDILEAIHRGVDMFDCIIPSQLAHRGVAFTSHGKLQFRRSIHKFSQEPIDAQCTCQSCLNYTRSYIHHLVKSDEPLAWFLLTCHNLSFYHRLVTEIRESILKGCFLTYYENIRPVLVRTDEDNPRVPPKRAKISRIPKLGDYEIHTSSKGFSSIRQISSGEIMHSVISPSEEANKLYIEQSHLASRLLKSKTNSGDLVIWDVGLGAASNAMAVVNCFEKVISEKDEKVFRPLKLVSFECDLDPLTLACKNAGNFPHLRHSAPYQILENGRWEHSSKLFSWELLKGDFLSLFLTARVPELIFYDPFSYKANSTLWSTETFSKIIAHCLSTDISAELYTYSSSTAVRVSLLCAGFYLAEGVGTGPKADTTIAFTKSNGAFSHPSSPILLGNEWLSRWRRSEAQFPAGLSIEERAKIEKLIENHPQFLNY